MGEVYRARDPRLGRDVAIKILPEHLATDRDALTRFEREAKAIAALSHAHILAVFDVGADQGVSYVVTELLEGQTLRTRLRRRRSAGATPSRLAPRSPRGWRARTRRASSIATSSPTTSSSPPKAA